MINVQAILPERKVVLINTSIVGFRDYYNKLYSDVVVRRAIDSAIKNWAVSNTQKNDNVKTHDIDNDGILVVLYDSKAIKALLAKSWGKETVPYDFVVNGAIILHLLKVKLMKEYGEKHDLVLLFEKICCENSFDKDVFCKIFSVLVNGQVIYNAEYNTRELSKFIYIFNMTIRTKFGNEDGHVRKVLQYIHDFMVYQKFNIDDGEERKYVDVFVKILPLLIVTKRGGFENALNATILIYKEILKKNFVVKDSKNCCFSSRYGVNNFDALDALFKNSKDFEPVSNDFVKNEIPQNDLMDIQDKVKAIVDGIKASKATLIDNRKDTSAFYEKVVNEKRKEIQRLNVLFKNLFVELGSTRHFDGDVDLKMQQNAYIASITGEEQKVYNYYKLKYVDVDIVILRDTSGSIFGVSDAYTTMVIMLLAAVNNIPGVRTCQIDFGNKMFVNKTFDSGIDTAKIYPHAEGGTDIVPALDYLQKIKFKGKLRLAFVLSDGMFNEHGVANGMIEYLQKAQDLQFIKYAINGFNASDFKCVEIDKIPGEIMKDVLQRRNSYA